MKNVSQNQRKKIKTRYFVPLLGEDRKKVKLWKVEGFWFSALKVCDNSFAIRQKINYDWDEDCQIGIIKEIGEEEVALII